MNKLLPIPKDIHRTLIDALRTEEEEYGRTAETVNARIWVQELAKQWPTLDGLPDGIDRFAQHPVSGEAIAPQQES